MLWSAVSKKLLAIALAIAVLAIGSTAFAGGDRLECKAESATEDASMDGKFESDGARDKFSASFEAAPDGSFMAGDVLQVTVGAEDVGDITLAVLANGDLGGDLNFDTTAGPADDDSPFPGNFPGVGAGTIVNVGTLGCSLQNR